MSAKNQDGIDIRQALEILSERSVEPHAQPDATEECHQNIPKEGVKWGQQIDMTSCQETQESMDERKAKVEEERSNRLIKIQETLKEMSVKDLLSCILDSQQHRVATYKTYDSGLEEVLKTGNVSQYPTICAEATASFSVLSETINIALKNLDHRKDLTALVSRLQASEKEKLNFTAALHMERIRLTSQLKIEESVSDGDTRISSLLEKGTTSLQSKIAKTIEGINEILEELRFSLLDEE